MSNMNQKQWMLFNDGPTISQLKAHYNLKEGDMKNLFDIVTAISNLKEDEYLSIDKKQMIFPRGEGYKFREMNSKEFKKHGEQFNMGTKTKEKMIRKGISPQQLMIDVVKKEYDNLNLLEIDNDYNVGTLTQHNLEVFGEIARRGFKFDRFGEHVVIPQRDLLAGWRLASLIMGLDLKVKYSNPGDNFYIHLPSTQENPNDEKKRYIVSISNLATNLPDAFGDWIDIVVNKTSEDPERKFDMFTPWSKRYKRDEVRLDFQYIAAMILRQHYNDVRIRQRKSKNLKLKSEHKIASVELNIPIPPTEEMINFDVNLDRVYVKGGNKLNAGQREIFYSLKLFMEGVDNCYTRDDRLESIDTVAGMYRSKLKEPMLRKMYLSLK